ncbi:hypothetical protein DIURU_002235 [Diutina rugosa]|uniref:Signal peptidase complex subunit 2 n=1 Tax=Diutina rugosa TaxID=5481 RepID=A0A642UR80_DIURU|nr:uncharacterized protein DIURU_002235 [Diutina rugosa]KAA8903723.1 hypothetical protein DIURU_002235 [Diutina rugosa]
MLLVSIKDLRETTELELPVVLTQLGYDEIFWLTDLKIAAGYGTVVLAGLMYWLEKKYKFKDVYLINAALIAVYFLLSALMWFFSNFSYANIKYIGKNKAGDKLTIKGWTDKYEPVYYVKITSEPKQGPPKSADGYLPFEKLFDGMGYINRDALVSLVETELAKLKK